MSMSLFSNVFVLLIQTAIFLFVPKIIGKTEFAYWQLYIFYSTYVSLANLGWPDGLHLKHGGQELESLNKSSISGQYRVYLIFQTVATALLLVGTALFRGDVDKKTVLLLTVIFLFVSNVRQFFLLLFQTTNKIKEYASLLVMAKAVSAVLIIVSFAIGIKDYRVIIATDIIGVALSLIIPLVRHRELLLGRFRADHALMVEIFDNIRIGIKVILAYYASVVIIGVVRFGIERYWDVDTFGEVSMTLSLSGLMMVFIQAISIVIFPMLKAEKNVQYGKLYSLIQPVTMHALLLLLLLYYPVYWFMTAWLPQFTESMKYLVFVFPLFVFEGKKALLTNTFLKANRNEKDIMNANLTSVVVAVGLTVVFTNIYPNLTLMVLSIPLLTALSTYLSEFFLAKRLQIRLTKGIFLELAVCVLFILSVIYLKTWLSFASLVFLLALNIFLCRKELKESITYFRAVVK
jgi:O-antigen/teichoic acid export membrane protein